MADVSKDSRIVLTLDAGGTNFRFSAVRGGVPITERFNLPSNGDDLEKCLANIVEGFTHIKGQCPESPSAISFAFPGPADYPNGIIGELVNLKGFRGGVALGPMLEDKFKIPVYISNDADLFVYGESIGGLLPHVNGLLEKAGSTKRFNNLFGVTLGTGFGGGLVRNGEIFLGDNSMSTEIWALRNKVHPTMNAEEGASIRAVRRVYADGAGMTFEQAPDPKVISDIATGKAPGNRAAAVEAYRQLGEVVGDAIANSLAVVDGLAVIGGGLSASWPLFLPATMKELNSKYTNANGTLRMRLSTVVFNLQDPAELEKFLRGEKREITVPGSGRKVTYDPLQRLGVGITRLGTSEAVALGAYAFAMQKLDGRNP